MRLRVPGKAFALCSTLRLPQLPALLEREHPTTQQGQEAGVERAGEERLHGGTDEDGRGTRGSGGSGRGSPGRGSSEKRR